jgi:hypothetical protein
MLEHLLFFLELYLRDRAGEFSIYKRSYPARVTIALVRFLPHPERIPGYLIHYNWDKGYD